MNPLFFTYVDDQQQQWNFWDETWSHVYGPFLTREDADRALKLYVITLDRPLTRDEGQEFRELLSQTNHGRM